MSCAGGPRVSVIIATYNYGAFITDSLRSVEEQTLHEWECLIVDDASTDDTAAVVAKFTDRDPRFRIIRMERNSGVSAARNRALQEAQGEFIQLLDADDVMAPAKLELHVRCLRNTPDVSVVYSDFVHFSGSVDMLAAGGTVAEDKFSHEGPKVVSRLLRGNAFRLNAMLFRKAVVDRLGGFKEQFRYVEDWDFWMRIASSGHHFHFLDEPRAKVGVRVAHHSLSRDLPAMRRYQLPVREQMWVQGGLDFRQRVSLLLRYCDFLLEMVVVKREKVLFLDEGSAVFRMLAFATSIVMFPFWIIVRPFMRSWG